MVIGESRKVGLGLFAPRPPAVAVLALVALVAGVISLLAARFPLDPHSPVHLDVGIGLYSLVLGGFLWVAAARTPAAFAVSIRARSNRGVQRPLS